MWKKQKQKNNEKQENQSANLFVKSPNMVINLILGFINQPYLVDALFCFCVRWKMPDSIHMGGIKKKEHAFYKQLACLPSTSRQKSRQNNC